MSQNNVVIKFILTSAIFHYYHDSIGFNKLRHESYDFIVIGGGSAGALVATRLSEVSKFNVLLLERGGSSGNYFTEIPFVASLIGYEEPLIRTFKSVKQSSACGLTDGICTMHAGAGLGGGSTHNDFVWNRGSPKDYDDWQDKYGAKGWSYADVVPYFKKVEDFLNKSLAGNLFGRTPGAIKITTPDSYANLSSILLKALSKGGYKIGNYNGRHPARASLIQATVHHGKRSSSWTAFLKPVIKRRNLDIVSFAAVNKINFDSNKRAVSV